MVNLVDCAHMRGQWNKCLMHVLTASCPVSGLMVGSVHTFQWPKQSRSGKNTL